MDFDKIFREPVEVYLAAIGDTEPLACRLLSDEPITDWEREALAIFVRGELKPPVRKRGQRRIPYLTSIQDIPEKIMTDAVFDYHYIMTRVEDETGSKHGMKFDVAEFIAKRDCLEVEALINRINRPKSSEKPVNHAVNTPGVVREFHRWLHRTGRIPHYPRYVSAPGITAALVKEMRRLNSESK